ncbi:aspartate aminotransferase family protein, partial [Salmonella enterica subsp. enterica serovar Enteritidis]|nr:aspartate aminotransferase family protein [Salmonella enterica subsp. enterica serovar Enteritidis]
MNVMTKTAPRAREQVKAPALAPNATQKPDLITVEQAKAMDVATMTELFKAHINPGQL